MSAKALMPFPIKRLSRKKLGWMVTVLLLPLIIGGAWVCSRLSLDTAAWGQLATTTGVFVLVVMLAIYRYWHAVKPTNDFQKLFEAVRDGTAAIRELDRVGGVLTPIVPNVKELFTELRRLKAELVQINSEISDRVAVRTDVIERKIGALRAQATRDPLTNLFNRRMLEETLPQLIEKCRAAKKPLSVLAIDVDHFKPLNDTLGHAAGDDYLKQLAQIIRSTIRADDSAFRIGGDEFVVLLPGAGEEPTAAIASRLRSLSEALAKPLKLPKTPGMSIGFAQLITEHENGGDLLEAADKALYAAKGARKKGDARRAG